MSASSTRTDVVASEPNALISEHCSGMFRKLVEETGGCEVFAIGVCGLSGTVEELDPIAFGNWNSVPAPAQNARAGQVLIHNHPSGDLQPSSADIDIASLYGKCGVGFYIVDNQCNRVRVVVKPFVEVQEVPVDGTALAREFGPDGTLASRMRGYEFRPQQIQMLQLVAEAFNRQRIAVVEAGTGTGKSFAYVAPSVSWAITNRKRVVISTNTINLQEQLLGKDLPELREKFGWDFKAVLVKGRSNYVSMRRLNAAARDAEFLPDGRGDEARKLLEWAKKTSDGSLSDIPFEVNDETWDAVQSDPDDCLRARCPHFDECFFYRSRREAASADVIVANHHIVMADLALKKDHTGNDFAAILPPFERVVFDEAHHVEAVATEYFSTETSLYALRRQLSKLLSTRESKGALVRLHRAILEHDAGNLYPPTGQLLKMLGEELPMARRDVEMVLTGQFEELFHRTLQQFGIERLGSRERRDIRISDSVAGTDYWKTACELLQVALDELTSFLRLIGKMLNVLKGYPEEVAKEIADARMAVASCHTKLGERTAAISFFLKAESDQFCRWLELSVWRDRPSVRICAAPLNMADQLRAAVFARKKTVVLTSATLTVDRRFDFMAHQLGLQRPEDAAEDSSGEMGDNPLARIEERCDYLLLGTPFDFERNCMAAITLDLPSPVDHGFVEASLPVIHEAIRITHGRAFVLFTSYRALERAYDVLAPLLSVDGVVPFRQGEMPRNRLLEVFRSTPNAALFATASFWEGVDVQGRALECLIITRLPFHVPTTPILEARTERIDRNGGNSFRELTVPLAVIRFRQGFGRLIRSKTDRGIVLILDNRVATKDYGKMFMRSLPKTRLVVDSTRSVLDELRLFYGGEGA